MWFCAVRCRGRHMHPLFRLSWPHRYAHTNTDMHIETHTKTHTWTYTETHAHGLAQTHGHTDTHRTHISGSLSCCALCCTSRVSLLAFSWMKVSSPVLRSLDTMEACSLANARKAITMAMSRDRPRVGMRVRRMRMRYDARTRHNGEQC